MALQTYMKAKHLLYKLALVAGILSLLSVKTYAQCSNFTAYFVIAVDSANCKKVILTNKSTETDSNTTYKWVLGDGTQSTGKNADHIYSTNDTFTICLYVTKIVNNTICSDSICKDVIINCNTCKVEADFTFRGDSANCKKIIFTNTSGLTNSYTTYSWKFGDNGTSNDKTPSHTFGDSTTYTVCLKAIKTDGNATCSDSICKQVTVCPHTNNCKVEADFTFRGDSSNCKKIILTNTSGLTNNTTTYTWKFGDNTISHDKTPSHTYGDSNTYTICLKVEKTDGNYMCADSICKQVTVCPPTNTCRVEANYTFKSDSLNCKKIIFTNTSGLTNNTTTYSWHFGDNTVSQDKNITHEYTSTGTFNACLVVTKTDGNAVCKDTVCKLITLHCDTGCNVKAYFSYVRDSADCKKIHFTNLSVGMNITTQVGWRFDDGTYSADRSVSHTYNDTGRYTVCMRVIKTDGNKECRDSICKSVHVECVACTVNAEFTYRADSGDCKRIFFKPNTGANTGSFKWVFGDGTTSPNYDPGHNYSNPDHYKVCLTVTKVENNRVCKDSFCREIAVCLTNSVNNITNNGTLATAYPNPFTNELTIALSNAVETDLIVTVTDMLDKTMAIETLPYGAQTITLNTANLPKGIYMIAVQNASQLVQRIKVVK